MKFVQATVSAFLFASHCLQKVASHGVETRYCITTAGNLRIFIEHWHDALSSPSRAGTMTIQDLTTAGQPQQDLIANGILNNVSWNQIHVSGNCAGGSITTEVSTCAPGAWRPGKSQNNWVYRWNL